MRGTKSLAWYRVFLNDQSAPVFTRTHQWASLLLDKSVNAIYSHMKSLREYKRECEPDREVCSKMTKMLLYLFEPGREKTGFFAYAKIKTQISCPVTAKLISAFVFAIRIVQSLNYLNPKFQASRLTIFCGCTAQFVSDLVGNPEDRFSHNEAHFILNSCLLCVFVPKAQTRLRQSFKEYKR